MSSTARDEGWARPQPRELTPIMTQHARERCAEMGISTKVAKRIWQHRTLVRGMDDQHRMVVTSTEHPGYALVVDETGGGAPVVVTVLFAATEQYVREGKTYRVVRDGRGHRPRAP